ncbi:unnamed protein product, partial [Cyprideis torosa]
MRISTLPSGSNERVVLRLLDRQAGRLNLEQLGMHPDVLSKVAELIGKPHGIFLVTGPTGSGKTTTLYAALGQLNNRSRNILTVEDPVEYYIDGIGQTQVNTKVDMSFARGLRAILRQDPDIVMVGEIRDLETAEIAVQSSLTGHLVFSTLHTNTAVGAVTRLRDMGVEPFLLSSTLLGVLAQRLVRRLCPHCKEPHEATPAERQKLNLSIDSPSTIWSPKGCDACNNSGYLGRSGLYELVVVDSEMQTMIHDGASEQKLEAAARKNTAGIRNDGVDKILEGITSVDEVMRLLREKELVPLEIHEVKDSGPKGSGLKISRGSMSSLDLALVTRQMATLLQAGTPLEETLGAIANQTSKKIVNRTMLGVRGKVVEGYSLADSLGQFPNTFPELYRATIAAGENSGHLDAVLERLADYTENHQAMQQKITSALIYPVLLTGIAILVVSGLLGYVVPQVVGV